jgi:membrane protease YdiL (CAAX protease family)
VAFVAFPEEYLFRGVLQPALGRAWKGVVLASLVFGLVHALFYADLTRALVVFPSLVFGWLRVETRSIAPSVFLHAACNAVDEAVRLA